jgi:hypothetical protein
VVTPWVAAPAHRIATSICPREDPSVTPKTPPGASRGLGSGHSIPIGEPAVGPPRSGFVLRACIRKAGGACVEAALVDGLADTTFFKRRIAATSAFGRISTNRPGFPPIPPVRGQGSSVRPPPRITHFVRLPNPMAPENAQEAGSRTGWKAVLAVIDGWRPGAEYSQQGSAHPGPGLIPGLAGVF